MKRRAYKMRGYRAASSEHVSWMSVGSPTVSPSSGPYAGESFANVVIDSLVTRYAPNVTAISPNQAVKGSGEIVVTLTGNDFFPTSKVYADNAELVTEYVSRDQIKATLPASAIAAFGQRQIVVVTPNVAGKIPIGGTSDAVPFHVGVQAAALTPTTMTRFSGASNTLEISAAENISSASSLFFRFTRSDGQTEDVSAAPYGAIAASCTVPEWVLDENGTITVQLFVFGALSSSLSLTVGQPSWLAGEYRADKSVVVVAGTSKVSAWQNSEGNADTGRHLVQSLSNRQPTFVQADTSFNNRSVVRFDRDATTTYDWMASGVWNDTGNPIHAPCNHWVVGKNTVTNAVSGTNFSAISGINAYYSHGLGVSSATSPAKTYAKGATSTWPTVAFAWDTPSAVGVLFNGNSSRVYANQATSYTSVALSTFGGLVQYASYLASGTGSNVEPTNTQVGVSRLTDAVGAWNGPIAHILLARTQVTDTENAHVMRYLGRRYGIAIS